MVESIVYFFLVCALLNNLGYWKEVNYEFNMVYKHLFKKV